MSNQTLSDQFNSILTEYQNTYKGFINSINSSNDSLVTVPNTLFSSQTSISLTPNSSTKLCQSSCSSNNSCTGATIDSNNNCTLSSGDGTLIASNTTSIVPQSISYVYQLQQLNNQLLSINQQMMNTSNTDTNKYQVNQTNINQKQNLILKNYKTLTQERNSLDKMITQFDSLDSAYDNGSINLNANYYNYIALLFISILLAFLLMKFSVTGQQTGGGNGNNFKREALFLLGIMIVFLGLSKLFKNLNSFIFTAVLLIAYLVAKIKLNQ